ncbi:MAG TPA: hypothetical protein VJ043_01940 [Candidatus Paceibacterota bacterium]|nr:hypothetical protein [Candidatus Paceibacterota bacterium]
MRNRPREPAKVLKFTGKIERTPEQVLELKRKELDQFANDIIARWNRRLNASEQEKRNAARATIIAQYKLEEIERYLTDTREQRPNDRMRFTELAYADAYMIKRKEMQKEPDNKI